MTNGVYDFRSIYDEEIVDEFCKGYYGKASEKVKEYIYLFEDNIKGKKKSKMLKKSIFLPKTPVKT